MRRIELNTSSFLASQDDKKFVILGSEKATRPHFVESVILPKINKEIADSIPGFWGTLGFADDKPIDWQGHLEISSNGNDQFTGVVKEEVELIMECHPQLKENQSSILEYFISFEHVNFSMPEVFSLDKIPKLRLDIMLEPHEGAIVFYQSDKVNNDDTSIAYIHPQPTENHDIHNRDRLTYLFDIIPQYELQEAPNMPGFYQLDTQKSDLPFIIKIITFQRVFDSISPETVLNSKNLLHQAHDELVKNRLIKPHKLLVFDRESNEFIDATPGNTYDDRKTLLLIHGTFSDTEGSYGDLYGEKGTWLKDVTNPDLPKHYEQVLAFDHPTFFEGAAENIDALYKWLDKVAIANFKQEVDLLGSSQGGLLVQYLANLDNLRIPVGKAVLIASANGVEYLTDAQFVEKFFTLLKHLFKFTGQKGLQIISSIVQHSAEFVLKQPGMQIMTPGNPQLNNIINNTPYREETIYWPIIDDFNDSCVHAKNPFILFLKRKAANAVDRITQLLLGKYNDWVVNTKNQFLIPAKYCAIPNYNPSKFRDHMISAIHGTCLKTKEAIDTLNNFLLGTPSVNPQPLPSDMIDAHCHLMGREIITGRILFLLIEELISYKNVKSSKAKLDLLHNVNNKKDEKKKKKDKKKEPGSVAGNIIKYFVLNKNSYKVLDDLDEQYHQLKSDVYRYIPLMFDLEMTFRNNYNDANIDDTLLSTEKEYIKLVKSYLDDIDKLIGKFDNANERIFEGSLIENEDSIKTLKILRQCINSLDVLSPNLSHHTKTGYDKQLDEMKVLKMRYNENIYPFLAVDPRRENMAQIILDNVGKGKAFHGIKLYAPNGYSPSDPHLFDDASQFIDGMCLYSWCTKNSIPVLAHCSNAGFATFAMELEVMGDVNIDDQITHYDIPTKITFKNNIFKGGFSEAVKERAKTLNHPKIWEIVLTKHDKLQLCLAHFGGASDDWRKDIAKLMGRFTNLYTDLSCISVPEILEGIKTDYYEAKDPIIERISYGSDFYFNMIFSPSFKYYYENFTNIFDTADLDKMSIEVPKKFLMVDY
ncbi:MAG: amidohydrolase family protein [Bacteroidales bacterium]|nr:amidohydrolase family protein [Bacteroidales bacterium]